MYFLIVEFCKICPTTKYAGCYAQNVTPSPTTKSAVGLWITGLHMGRWNLGLFSYEIDLDFDMDSEFDLGCFLIRVLNFDFFFTEFKEQVKRVERKNRDEFRKMMEEDVASGTFTAKTLWFDYCQKASIVQIDLFCEVSLFCYFLSPQIQLFALCLWL